MGKEIRYEKVEADEWALFHRVRVKFDGTWIRCNGSERECFVPWKARDAADWSMICAYLRLDDEGRKRVIEEIEYQTSRMMKEREEERRAWLSKDI